MTNYERLKEYEAHQTPVPSYEEWQASYNCMLENEVLRLKNDQLKELLKECEPFIVFFIEHKSSEGWQTPNSSKLLQKISEVLK